MKKIKKDNNILAIVLNSDLDKGTTPLTDEEWPLQALSLNHPKGTVLDPHYHKSKTRKTDKLMEAIVVFSGKVKIDIYYKKKIYETVILERGQTIIINTGIGIEVIEDAKMIEFKNGPFVEDKVVI